MASQSEFDKNRDKKPAWLKQVWFAGCHSDIGGSYLEPESRLSDISLGWMVDELKECVPNVQIRKELLIRSPDPLALQHEETYMFKFGPFWKKWKTRPRTVDSHIALHPSVLVRLAAPAVPQLGEVKPYRPPQLANHPAAKKYYRGK